MKLIIKKNELEESPELFMRHAGYSYINDRRTGNESFARRLGRDFYPRFHVYLKDLGENIEINLHLDQKRPSYAGTHAHNAEYDGKPVEDEINRLKGLIDPFA